MQLRAYQKCAIQKIALHYNSGGHGFLLADAPRVGKTHVALAFAKLINSPVTVVCPATIKGQWVEYANQYDLKLYITSYEYFRDNYSKYPTKYVIYDEAHKLKNKKTKIYKVAYNLKPEFIMLLTGTPFQNEPLELVNLIKIIKGNYRIVDIAARWVDMPWGRQYVWVKNKLSELKSVLARQPWYMRRELEDVTNELPTITREAITPNNIEWSEILKKVDELIESERNDENSHKIDMIKLGLFEEVGVLFNVMPLIRRILGEAKALFAANYIVDLANDTHEQLLVFTHHNDVRDILAKILTKNNIKYDIIQGDTLQKQRNDAVQKFKVGDVQILILSTRAAGEGLTLNEAARAVFVELDYNPAILWQAENRMISINDKNKIATYIIAPHPLEKRMVQLVNKKAHAISEIYTKDITKI